MCLEPHQLVNSSRVALWHSRASSMQLRAGRTALEGVGLEPSLRSAIRAMTTS